MTNERTCLYRMYGAKGALLYVGITNCPELRFSQHACDKPWWGEVKRIDKMWLPSRDDAERTEKYAIRTEHPLYNIEHNLDNPYRVVYRKRVVAPRRRRPRATVSGWGWVMAIGVVLALTTAVGPWVGVVGLVGLLVLHNFTQRK